MPSPVPRSCPGAARAAAIIAGVAPYDAEGLDFLDGMGPENIEEFGLAAAGGAPFADFLIRESAQLATLSGPDMAEALGGLVSDVDKAALTGALADFMARALVGGGIGEHRRLARRRRGLPGRLGIRPGLTSTAPSPSGKDARTAWSPTRTVSGSPRTSREPDRTFWPTRGTSRCSSAPSTTSSTTCSPWQR